MANESAAGGTSESGRKGQQPGQPAQQAGSAGGSQQARSAGGTQQQPSSSREGAERSGGLSRREWPLAGGMFATSPFSLMRRMMEDLDRLFEDFGTRREQTETGRRYLTRRSTEREVFWTPHVDVFERDGKLVVRADLPGLSRDDVRVEVEDGALTIEGERRQERESEGAGTYHAERVYGMFRRVIPLPEGVDPQSAEARFDSGVLEVSIPLPAEKRRGRRVEIQQGKGGESSVH
jgi:HSP20 family protein